MITRWKFGTAYFNGEPAEPGATIPPTADIQSISIHWHSSHLGEPYIFHRRF